MAVLKLDTHVPDDTLSFLNLFNYGSRHFVAIDPRGAMPTLDTEDVYELQTLNNAGYNIYYCPNSLNGKRKDENVDRVRAVWIDDDKGVVNIAKLPQPPSVIVNTSPDKFQFLWLTDTTSVNLASTINLGLAQKFDGDLKVFNPSRILRLPGYRNHKYKDSPLVTCKILSDEFIPWETIRDTFPRAETDDPNPKDWGKPRFSFRNAVHDILTGDSIHGPRISLSMHCANMGMPKRDVLEFLDSLVSDAIQAGTVDPKRGVERLANMKQCVESAYAKLEMEQPPVIRPGEGLNQFTRLPAMLDGGLKAIVEAHMKTMRYQSYEMAVPTAMHLISTYGGGVYSIGTQTMSRSRVILARTGAGKNAISVFDALIKKELIKRSINAHSFHCSESFNIASDVHIELCQFRVRGHFIEEAGENAKSGLGAKNENRAFILKALTCGTLKSLEPKKFSSRTAGNRNANEDLKPLWGICYSVLSESVPESYTQVIKDEGQFTDGLVPRQELIFINPHKPYRNKDQIEKIPLEVTNIFATLASKFISLKAERGDNADNTELFTKIDTTEIDDLLEDLEDEYVDMQNSSSSDDVSHALYSRFAEKVSCTILILAVADAAYNAKNGIIELPKATPAHFYWAVDYHKALVETILKQSEHGSLADPFDLCCKRLYEHLISFGTREFDQAYKNDIITASWITRVLDKTKFKAVATVIKDVYRNNRSAFTRDIIGHALDNGWILDVVGHQPKNTRFMGSWKINPALKGKRK